MITGQETKPKWFVIRLAILVQVWLFAALHAVRGLVQSGWIMFTAKVKRNFYLIAEAMNGETMTVTIERMVVWIVYHSHNELMSRHFHRTV